MNRTRNRANQATPLLAALLALAAFPISPVIAQIAPPNALNFQGRLAQSNGNPVPDGTYNLRLRLYDAATGGNTLADQTVASVPVKNGTFAVQLTSITAANFNGNTWLGISINGATDLTPRQQIVSVPYAIKSNLALTVSDGSITNAKIAAGTLTADKFAPNIFNPIAWLLGGNGGTNPASQFLGTTDNQPLVFRVNNRQAMRYSYAENTATAGQEYRSINVLGGSEINSISAGVVGATIAGGGIDYFTGTDAPNSVTADFGTVGGGSGNTVSGSYATVAGGLGSTASGSFATVAGGNTNTASGVNAIVGGGFINNATGVGAAVTGGYYNVASGDLSIVAGGYNNAASGSTATVGGGQYNTAAGVASFSAGRLAKAYHNYTFVWSDGSGIDFASTGANQFLIRAAGGVGINTNAPNAFFALQGNLADARFQIGGQGGDAHHLVWGRDAVFNAANGEFRFRRTPDINNLGATTTLLTLFGNGAATLAGTLTQNSDGRWKKNVTTFENALDAVLNLRGVTYEWKEADREAGRQIGFFAQEVEKVLPEVVRTDEHGYKSVAYQNLVPVLVEAVKALKKDNDHKGQRLSKVEAENSDIRKENAELKARLDAIERALAELVDKKR